MPSLATRAAIQRTRSLVVTLGLELPTGQRISMVTGYLDQASEMLRAPRFGSSPLAVQIREFASAGATAATSS